MSIDQATIHKVARLARLRVTEDEEKMMEDRLTRIFAWIEQLREVKTDEVEPMYSVHLEQMPQRADVVADGAGCAGVCARAGATSSASGIMTETLSSRSSPMRPKLILICLSSRK